MNSGSAIFDVFISHASEDKATVAIPLADRLEKLGFTVWLDEKELELGDQLRGKIHQGLKNCRYGVVILSQSFFAKSWPQEELDALMDKEGVNKTKIVLPIRHEISHSDITDYYPTLASKLSISTEAGLDEVVKKVAKVLGSPVVEKALLQTQPPISCIPTNLEKNSKKEHHTPNLSARKKLLIVPTVFLLVSVVALFFNYSSKLGITEKSYEKQQHNESVALPKSSDSDNGKGIETELQADLVVRLYQKQPEKICANQHEVFVNIWLTSSGIDGRLVLYSASLQGGKKDMKVKQTLKLSGDCQLKLINIGQENFVPGRKQRRFAEIELLTE